VQSDDDLDDDDWEESPRALSFDALRERLIEAARNAGRALLHVGVTLNLNTLDRSLTLKLVPAAWEGSLDHPYAEVETGFGAVDATMAIG
jgi:hypothetical protein